MLMARGRVHDRTTKDVPYNAVTATVEVDDPYPVPGVSRRIKATASLRDDPLRRLHVRRQIDDPGYYAGRHWQRLYEQTEIGGLRAIDPSVEAVDGGRFPELITDVQRRAWYELNRLSRALGQDGDALVRDVLGNGLFVYESAVKRGIFNERGVRALSNKLKECLDILAFELGFIPRRPRL
jgi:hypothetical protein